MARRGLFNTVFTRPPVSPDFPSRSAERTRNAQEAILLRLLD
jgi:hypothetical protein